MTSDQMKVAESFHANVTRAIGNLDCVIFEPNPEQVERLEELLDRLNERIEAIRYRLSGP